MGYAYVPFGGNDEGSIFKGSDGKTYQVINGREVQIPAGMLIYRDPNSTAQGIDGGTLDLSSWGSQSQKPNSGLQAQSGDGANSSLILVGIGALALLLLSRR